MARLPARGDELKRKREMLITRATLERAAMSDATQDFQLASERIARIAVTGVTLARRYWLPASLLLAAGMFKRVRPVLRMARTGLMIWQATRMLRGPRGQI